MNKLKKEIDKVIPKKGMFKQAGYFVNKLIKNICEFNNKNIDELYKFINKNCVSLDTHNSDVNGINYFLKSAIFNVYPKFSCTASYGFNSFTPDNQMLFIYDSYADKFIKIEEAEYINASKYIICTPKLKLTDSFITHDSGTRNSLNIYNCDEVYIENIQFNSITLDNCKSINKLFTTKLGSLRIDQLNAPIINPNSFVSSNGTVLGTDLVGSTKMELMIPKNAVGYDSDLWQTFITNSGCRVVRYS